MPKEQIRHCQNKNIIETIKELFKIKFLNIVFSIDLIFLLYKIRILLSLSKANKMKYMAKEELFKMTNKVIKSSMLYTSLISVLSFYITRLNLKKQPKVLGVKNI